MITNTALSVLYTAGQNPQSSYTPNANAWLSNLVNKIGLTYYQGVSGYMNPFNRFRTRFEWGDTIETPFAEIIAGGAFSLSANNPYRINNPSVLNSYHTLGKHVQYEATLRDIELRKAENGNLLGTLEGVVLGSMASGRELDEFNACKLFFYPTGDKTTGTTPDEFGFCDDFVKYDVVNNPITTDANKIAFAQQIFADINETLDALDFMQQLNVANTPNFTSRENAIVLLNKKYYRIMKNNVLAATYNADYKKIDVTEGNLILLDEDIDTGNAGSGLTRWSTVWAVLDANRLIYAFQHESQTSVRNEPDHYTNFFMDYDRIISYPLTATAVMGVYLTAGS